MKELPQIIIRRIEIKIDIKFINDQFVFRRGNGRRKAILTLPQIIEKTYTKGKRTSISFADFKKAFDNINWNLKIELLQKEEVSDIE